MVNIDCLRDCIAGYEVIAKELSEEAIRLKNMASSHKKNESVYQKSLVLASQLDEQTQKIIDIAHKLKKYCDESEFAEQEIIHQIKRKLFLNDPSSLLGDIIIETDIIKTKTAILCNHALIHDKWIDDIILSNIAEDNNI